MSNIDPAVAAITNELSSFLGPFAGETQYIRWWRIGEFEVAVQRETGPHVWVSAKWRPTGGVFAELDIERYPADRTRNSNLLGNCPTLCVGNATRCIKNVGSQVPTVVRCIKACAAVAGVTSASDA